MTGIAPHSARQTVPASGAPHRIGPNAILQLADVLRARTGESETRAVFARAGLTGLLDAPPAEMIDEALAAALFRAHFHHFDPERATALAAQAGTQTADYVMAHRIPALVRKLLMVLPERFSAPMLLHAIARHAWTFAGSGACTVQTHRPYTIEIADNPLAIGSCAWHTAVFRRLFTTLVSSRLSVAHPLCCAQGAPSCRFEITRS